MRSEATRHIVPGIPHRQIRAVYDDRIIRVYQAYSNAIADAALEHGTFVSPPFKMARMTWLKPSFLWMMYRAGWGLKDPGQSRILAIDVTREGFEWALTHSCLSSQAHELADRAAWRSLKTAMPVLIQWDPERDLLLHPLEHRTLQIGLSNEAVRRYVHEWISRITDITDMAHTMRYLVSNHRLDDARAMLPEEHHYPLSSKIEAQLGMSQRLQGS